MAQSVARGEDRRAHQRANLKTSINFGSDSNFYTGFTRDLSEGGVFVATHNVLPIGTVIDIEFSIPDDGPPLQVQGEVRWAAEYSETSDGHPGLGVRFVDLPDDLRQRIERFVRVRDTMFFEE